MQTPLWLRLSLTCINGVASSGMRAEIRAGELLRAQLRQLASNGRSWRRCRDRRSKMRTTRSPSAVRSARPNLMRIDKKFRGACVRTGISFANCNTLIFHVQLMRAGSDTTTRLPAISLIQLRRRHGGRSSLCHDARRFMGSPFASRAVLEITADGLNRLRASMLSASMILLIFSSVSRFSILAFSPLSAA